MRSYIVLIVLVLWCASTLFGQRIPSKPTTDAASSQSDVRTSILKLEDANHKARLAGDRTVLDSLYADDFTGINAAGGKTDKLNIVDFYTKDGAVLAVSLTDDVSVRVMTNAVLVTARLKYQYNDRMSDQSISWLRYTRVYEKRGTAWRIVAEHFSFTDAPSK